MEQVVFRSEMEGLLAEQIVRDAGYSMVTRHFHSTYELYYLVEGDRYYFIDNDTYLVRAGDVVLIGPNHIHKTSQASPERYNRMLLQISGEMMNPFLRSCGLGSIEEMFGGDVRIFSMTERQRQMVAESFQRLQEELRRRQWQYAPAVRLELAELLLNLARLRAPDVPKKEPQIAQTWKHQKVHEVADYLTFHPETDENLEDLAKRFFISKSYLSRIFKEVTGFTVNEYKNISRIKKSQNLLQHSDLSITEIADELGFENLTYYERVFKRYADMTPLKYRKSLKY